MPPRVILILLLLPFSKLLMTASESDCAQSSIRRGGAKLPI